jgi:ParB-like chromosome segregation protein Spo0J
MKQTKEAGAIYCSHTKVVPIESLKPHPKNPNRHPQKQIALLAKVINANGWRYPIVVSKRCGLIIKGHGRLEAAKMLGLRMVPIDEQEYDSNEAELADMIADNRIPELSYSEFETLEKTMRELQDAKFDMDLTGYDSAELDKLFYEANEEETPEPNAQQKQVIGTVPQAEDQDEGETEVDGTQEGGEDEDNQAKGICPTCGQPVRG